VEDRALQLFADQPAEHVNQKAERPNKVHREPECSTSTALGDAVMPALTTEYHHELEEKVERDPRLDLFRGAGLWMIFLDHIPHDAIGWITLRNYGFSDAAEVFVFVSGYLAGFIYGPVIRAGHLLAATKRLWIRAGQMYVAHLMLFLLFTAQIARTARKLDNPMYENEFNVFNFLQHPDILIGQALTLRYKPVDLDVLPLFIVLVLFSPFVIWGLTRRPNLTLACSACLYVLARWFDWNIASYPAGATWYFNPFCWQLLFVFGQWCGVGQGTKLWAFIQSRTAIAVASLWLAFSFAIVMTWHFHALEVYVPQWLARVMYPIDKTDLDMFRLTHFLALAVLAVRFMPRDWSVLRRPLLRPLTLSGEHSLPLFCLGVMLSFSAHWVLTQYNGSVAAQLGVSITGITIMVVVARALQLAEEIPDLFVDVVAQQPRPVISASTSGNGPPST
jgi:hypothetical protein